MKLTSREKVLWLAVGAAVFGMFVFNVFYTNIDRLKTVAVDASELVETRHLLRSERNIIARQEAASAALTKIQGFFLDASDPESAKIELLKEVENLTGAIGLAVDQKNLLQLEPDVIGVALEGSAEPATLVRFLHALATARLGLDVKRLQLNVNEKTKELKYQIILQLLLVKKKAGQ